MSLTVPNYPDPYSVPDESGQPTEAIPLAHWQIDLTQLGGTVELAKDAPDLSAVSGRIAAHVHRSLAAAQAGSPPVAVEEYRFGDGVIATYEQALAAAMDDQHPDHALHLKLLQGQTLVKEWVEAQVLAHKHPAATINPDD